MLILTLCAVVYCLTVTGTLVRHMTHQHSHFVTLTPAVTASNLTQKQYQDIQTDSRSVTLSTSFAMELHLTLQFLNAGDTTACA